ncbi:MAG TPA: prepilin-type N-terminal cleavage/methylation domain-containing protein [Pyrinomonadaceae bacterium]|nr:prepilin-type N-terminal cleavage/methylation domain-containing protein [Pyrinomonadaceae bacterium]
MKRRIQLTGNPGRNDHGVGMMELVIVMALVGVISAFALVQIRSARAALRVQNSVRQLASYMEKARVDAVRRHSTSIVSFTDLRTYSVTMDFDSSGSATTRTFKFQDGVQLASSELPNVRFNWRGRTLNAGSSCVTTFAVSDPSGSGLSVDVSGSGDVTVENQQPTLPNVTYNNGLNSTDGIDSRAVITGAETTENTPCMDLSGGGTPASAGPPSCNIAVSSASISIKKNGGATGSVIVTMSNPSLVVATFPSNLTVSPASQTVSNGQSFSIVSKNTLRGPYNVTFTSQCGSSIIVKVNVTN